MHLGALISLLFTILAARGMADTLDVARISDRGNARPDATAPLQNIEHMEMERRGAVNLSEALRTISGVSIRDYGGLGGMKSISIRSFGAQHTGIIYDGTVITNAQNGQVDISRFNLEDIASISIETAGTNDIFRSARLAASVGTVSIESKAGEFRNGPTEASARMRIASFGTYNPYLSIKGRLNSAWSISLAADYVNSRGNYPFTLHNGELVTHETRLNSDFESVNAEMNVYGQIGGKGKFRAKASFYGDAKGLPGSVVLYTQNPSERLWTRDYAVNATYEHRISEQWKIKASADHSGKWNRYTDVRPGVHPDYDDRYFLQETSASAIALYSPLSCLDLSLAQDLSLDMLDMTLKAGETIEKREPRRIASFSSLNAKYHAHGLNAVFSMLVTAYGDRDKNDVSMHSKGHFSPSASISYRLFDKISHDGYGHSLNLRASVKESFRMPTFNDIYYPRIGTKDLNAEIAWQSNLGMVWEHPMGGKQRLEISADAYANMIRDKIVAVPSMFIWSMRNVGKVFMGGCDLRAGYKVHFTPWLDFDTDLSYSYQYAVDVTDRSSKNYRHQIAYTPRNRAGASAVVNTPWIRLGYTLQAVGERYTLAQNTASYRIEPYADHCLSIGGKYSFGRHRIWRLDVSAEALNLSGNNYEVIKYYPMPGRNYRLTVKLTY